MFFQRDGVGWHEARSNAERRMSIFSRKRAVRGFTLIELIVVMAILAIVLAVVAPWFYQALRRQRLMSPVREVYSLVLATRMQAVRRNQVVILAVCGVTAGAPLPCTAADVTNPRIVTWADNLPYDYLQNAGEPTINTYQIPPNIVFQFAPDGTTNGANAVAFDQYNGDGSLVDRLVFKGDGTLVTPQDSFSSPALTPSTYTTAVPYGSVNCKNPNSCRGIYVADNNQTGDQPNRNVFRIGVDDVGRVTLLKWIPTTGTPHGNAGEADYVAPPWNWVN